MSESSTVIRRAYRFAGWVQGVGFRWHASTAAAPLGVTGFVQNDADGTVYMEAQGSPLALDRLLAAIYQGRYIRIERVESKKLPLVPNERSFRVRD